MKKGFYTNMEESLLKELKIYSAKNNLKINEVIEKAISNLLNEGDK